MWRGDDHTPQGTSRAHARAHGAPLWKPRTAAEWAARVICAAVRAVQISELSGPDAISVVDAPSPEPTHMLTPGEGVVIDVKAAGVAFPDVLQTRGLYQLKPELPFIPGAEVAGTVAQAPAGSGFQGGRSRDGVHRARRHGGAGGGARVPHVPAARAARLRAGGVGDPQLPHGVLRAEAARPLGAEGERVLVHGAAGGRGDGRAAGGEGAWGVHDRGGVER